MILIDKRSELSNVKITPCPKCKGEDFTIEEDFINIGRFIICSKCGDKRELEK